jgi:AcrR family transcriptional regulator
MKEAPKRAAERILESAEELFYHEGIRAIGVDEIVARAGVTKPSLYRSYSSKDELAADYLRRHSAERRKAFDDAMVEISGDLRGSFRKWLKALSQKAASPNYRGCGNSNAAVEYPEHDHPARKVAAENKRLFLVRLRALAKAMGARRPEVLADALLLVIEGTYTSGQLFGPSGPARCLVDVADTLIDAYVAEPEQTSGAKKSRTRL